MVNRDPKKFTKSQLRYIFRRIVKRIKKKPKGYFVFRKMRGCYGLFCWEDGIQIDPRRHLVPTIIHEVLHDMYPKNWEGWTQRLESKVVNILSPYDIYILMGAFFQKLEMNTTSKKLKRKKIK